MSESNNDQLKRRRINLQLPDDVIGLIDQFRRDWALRSRGDTVERLLREMLVDRSLQAQDTDVSQGATEVVAEDTPFDESGALVLLSDRQDGLLAFDFERQKPGQTTTRRNPSGGIDLPGFVRKQSDQLKRAINPPVQPESVARVTFALVDAHSIDQAIDSAHRHWLELYGTAPNDRVLEAAMTWLGQDIWPNADQSEGRPFTWALASQVACQLAPSWTSQPASFERVIVMAGLLEDPFSGETLAVRVPTLIRRFVHRFRRRQRGMSFETLEHTMSLHGALKLLQLPTTPGNRLTLRDIREAYREQALLHHHDSGGSADQMRRLNEAYQMLKELYRAS